MSVWLKWQSIGVYLPHELRQITLMTLKASQSHIVYLVLPDHICTMSPCKNFPILLSGRLPTCTTGSSLFFKNMFSEKKWQKSKEFWAFWAMILDFQAWYPLAAVETQVFEPSLDFFVFAWACCDVWSNGSTWLCWRWHNLPFTMQDIRCHWMTWMALTWSD